MAGRQASRPLLLDPPAASRDRDVTEREAGQGAAGYDVAKWAELICDVTSPKYWKLLQKVVSWVCFKHKVWISSAAKPLKSWPDNKTANRNFTQNQPHDGLKCCLRFTSDSHVTTTSNFVFPLVVFSLCFCLCLRLCIYLYSCMFLGKPLPAPITFMLISISVCLPVSPSLLYILNEIQ